MAKTDMKLYMKERRRKRREALMDLKGSKCLVCGSTAKLEFDHRDRTTKSFVLSGQHLDKSWGRVLEELDKCDLLCYDCHRAKTVRMGEHGGGHNRNTDPYSHGTMRMYQEVACRCDACKSAKRAYRLKKVSYSGS